MGLVNRERLTVLPGSCCGARCADAQQGQFGQGIGLRQDAVSERDTVLGALGDHAIAQDALRDHPGDPDDTSWPREVGLGSAA